MPAHVALRLDGNAGAHRLRQHLFPVGLILHIEQIHAGHGHHARGKALFLQQVRRLYGILHLGAGGNQDYVGLAIFRIAQDIAALFRLAAAARQLRQVLARHGHDRGQAMPERGDIAGAGLANIRRTKHQRVRRRAQAGNLLDGLMGRSVLAHADAVVGEHIQHRKPHDGGQAQRGLQIIREHQEGGAEGAQAAIQRHAVAGGGHGKLPDAKMDVLSLAVLRREEGFALELGLVGGRKVRAAAKQVGQMLVEPIERGAAGRAGGDGLVRSKEALVAEERLGQRLAVVLLPEPVQLRIGRPVALEHGVIVVLRLLIARQEGRKVPIHVLRHDEGLLLPGIGLLHLLNRLNAQRLAMRRGHALLGRTVRNICMNDDERGHVRGLGALDRRVHRVDILAVRQLLHVPAIGFVTLFHILGKRNLGAALDGNPVAVVERDELAQLHRGGQRRGLGLNALHHAAIAHKHIGIIIHHGIALAVEDGGKVALRHGHAHRHGHALAQRPGGGLNADRVAKLRMARGFAAPLAELLDVLDGQAVAKQVQERILQHGCMPRAQHKAVAGLPVGVFGVVLHLLPQRVGHGCGTDRQTGMSAVGLLHRFRNKNTDCGDCSLISRRHRIRLPPFVFQRRTRRKLSARPGHD